MKKAITIIIVTVLLLTVFFTVFLWCAQKDELVIQLCASPDSIPSAFSESYYTGWSMDPYKKTNVDPVVEVTLGDITVSGHYVRSEIRKPEYYETHWYATSEGNLFGISNEEELLVYHPPRPSDEEGNGKVYTEAECLDIARTFVDEFVDIDEYRVSSVYNSSLNWYVIHFEKYIGDLLTGDYIGVIVYEQNGSFAFDSMMFGKIPSDMEVSFDFEEIEALLFEKIEQTYSEEMGPYDKLSLGSFDYSLTADKQKHAVLICTVVATVTNYDENGNQTGRHGDTLTFRIFYD